MSKDYTQLEQLTSKLFEVNKTILTNFEEYTLNKIDADFIKVVKPFADEVKEISDKWLPMALHFVETVKPKYLFKHQIEDVHENLQIEAVACFQGDTKRKRFLERNKSVAYTLDMLLQSIKR
ncbi:YppE family protein [Evansella sp. AB-rgal1]|uniref:YppE family protein n=1 Tax=Evansella sp. AB-rgal1 TaxID=3242696 RepID=UPI00359DCD57